MSKKSRKSPGRPKMKPQRGWAVQMIVSHKRFADTIAAIHEQRPVSLHFERVDGGFEDAGEPASAPKARGRAKPEGSVREAIRAFAKRTKGPFSISDAMDAVNAAGHKASKSNTGVALAIMAKETNSVIKRAGKVGGGQYQYVGGE